jgi:hypothetical protein
MSKKHPYYKFNYVLSFNAIFNFLVGGRGIGKTYGATKLAIEDAVYRGNQFIYLRRYKTEMAPARNTFFTPFADKFPRWDFRVVGNEAQCAPARTRDNKKRQWRTIGYFLVLSNAQTQKSVSYQHVRTIIFDEFIIEKGLLRYLPDEADVFTNFYSTVDRWNDRVRVFFLANSVSIMNPYFLKYNIRPDQDGELVVRDNGFVLCHFIESEAFKTSVFETRFGKFIAGTEYAEYAVGNQFDDNHDSLINVKDAKMRYQYTLETRTGTFSVWNDVLTGEFFVQAKLPKRQLVFTMLADRMTSEKILMTLSDRPLGILRTAFTHGRVTFDAPSTRNTFAEIFK